MTFLMNTLIVEDWFFDFMNLLLFKVWINFSQQYIFKLFKLALFYYIESCIISSYSIFYYFINEVMEKIVFNIWKCIYNFIILFNQKLNKIILYDNKLKTAVIITRINKYFNKVIIFRWGHNLNIIVNNRVISPFINNA